MISVVITTNVEFYETRLLGKGYEHLGFSDDKFIIYHETITSEGEKNIDKIGLLKSGVRAEYFLPIIELNTVIFPVAEMQIDDTNKDIDYSIRELRNIEIEILSSGSINFVDMNIAKLNSWSISETKWYKVNKDLRELDKRII